MTGHFIERENISRYKQILAATSDEAKKATLRKLLAEEEARLAEPKTDRGSEQD